MNLELIESLIKTSANSQFKHIFKSCEQLKGNVESLPEYVDHKRLFILYGGLEFLFHGKYLDIKMTSDFFGNELLMGKLESLISNPSDLFLGIISYHVCYSKGYEASREFVFDNYGFELNRTGGSVADYKRGNYKSALKVINKSDGKW